MSKVDLIIIGAGPGGYRAAEYAAKQGLKVTIYESGEVGGTCLNVGCIPTKTYVHSKTFEEARQRMAQVIPQLRQGVEGILSHPNITLIRESARLENLSADNIIIATGSETKWLPIEGIKTDPRVVDSTGLLQLDTLPKRLAIIGAGVIGMEFGSVFNRFGSEVTVIEYLKECLPALDSDIAKRLRKTMEKRGITFKMKTAVQNVADIDADVILVATGRKPRAEGLGLEALGITLAPNGAIPVDENFQIVNCNLSNCKCFAIGDCNGLQMLAHAAEAQAIYVVNQIVNRQSDNQIVNRKYVNRKWLDIVPAAIFTDPEAACVGHTEDQLKAQSVPYVCKKAFWRANGKALAMGETEGMLKLFVSPPESGGAGGGLNPGKILGCHAYGAHSADIVQEVSVLMCKDTTLSELAQMVHIHPTLSEILKSAAES